MKFTRMKFTRTENEMCGKGKRAPYKLAYILDPAGASRIPQKVWKLHVGRSGAHSAASRIPQNVWKLHVG